MSDYCALGEAHAGTLRSLSCLGDRASQHKPHARQEPRTAPRPPPSPSTPVPCPRGWGAMAGAAVPGAGQPPRLSPGLSLIATPPSAVSPPGWSTGKKAGRDRPPLLPAPPKAQPGGDVMVGEGRAGGGDPLTSLSPARRAARGPGPPAPTGRPRGRGGSAVLSPPPGAAPPSACPCVSVRPCPCVPSRPRSAPAPGGRSPPPPPSAPHGAGGPRGAGGVSP